MHSLCIHTYKTCLHANKHTCMHARTHTHTHTHTIRVTKCSTHLDNKVTASTWYDTIQDEEEENVQKDLITHKMSLLHLH